MVMLNQIASGKFARIVKIENENLLGDRFKLNGIIEGDFVRVISCFGTITVEINNRIFSIGKNIAKKIRVIELI